jgi:hypothetical protein
LATLIPEMKLTDFKKLKAEQIKELKSVEVYSDGEYLFTAVIPAANGGSSVIGNIRTKAEYLCNTSNSVGGKNP